MNGGGFSTLRGGTGRLPLPNWQFQLAYFNLGHIPSGMLCLKCADITGPDWHPALSSLNRI